jgi:hypothetical protein
MSGGYVKSLMDDPLTLLRETPIATGDFLKAQLEPKSQNTLDYYHVPPEKRVSWFDVSKDLGDYRTEPKLVLHVETNRRSTEEDLQRGRVFRRGKALEPLFYLPFVLNELTRMKLEAPKGAKVNFFTTAMIDGCSVYVEGPATSPKVTHANAQAVETTSTGDDWGTKQIKIGKKTKHMTDQFALIKKGAAAVVERPNYIVEDPTQLLLVVQDFKRKRGLADDVEVQYAPFGAVVGFRNKFGNWTFYVQKNGVFSFDGPSQSGTRMVQYICNRVLSLDELWPNGNGNFKLIP